MKDLCFASALEIAEHIRDGRLSAVECLDYFHDRVCRYNDSINAIVVFDWERARTRAHAAERARRRGELWGPFHGVPMTVKESFDLKAHRTTAGDPQLAHGAVAEEDDLAVTQLERAGAVVFGKTNVPYRLLDFQSFNAIYGVTRNPWDTSLSPGGSSGGAAAALAAGLTGLELGSDLGGSIRQPAHACGVFGHKPTFGLVTTSRLGPPGRVGVTDMAVAGPLARSAEDLAMAMRYLSGTNVTNMPEASKPMSAYRVAVWCDETAIVASREVRQRCQEVAGELTKLGAIVSLEARPPFSASQALDTYLALLDASINPTQALTPSNRRELEDARARLQQGWREFFQHWDVMLAPSAPTTAFAHDQSPMASRTIDVDGQAVPYEQQLFWGALASASYLPSTAFPTGLSNAGLPIGLQAIGKWNDDFVVIDFARQLSNELRGFSSPPGYAG